jgi:Phage terminase large subunit.
MEFIEAWSGKGSDTFATTAYAFKLADDNDIEDWDFDSDGLGVGVRGDARVLNEKRTKDKQKVNPFRGSGAVIEKDKEVFKGEQGRRGRTNEDFFANRKAQEWWRLMERFKMTYRAVVEGLPYDPAEIISFDSKKITPKALTKLTQELSQPTWSQNGSGKILIDKAPQGSRSPNYADQCMMLYSKRARRSGF